jgi:suppressor of ftsI
MRRREFIARLGSVAAGPALWPLAAALAPGLSPLRAFAARAERQPLIEPPQIRSQNGVLDTTLTAEPGRIQLGETELPGFFYNGSYLPPLWRIQLGDVLRVRLRNELTEGFTNLHFHGMSVSPRGRSDNVFIHLSPGHEFNYEVKVPSVGRQEPGRVKAATVVELQAPRPATGSPRRRWP